MGSKFFHELQTGSRTSSRSKTYDVNAAFDDEIPAFAADEESVYVGDAWEEPEVVYDENDPDAVVCMQFEESLVEAMQSDPDLASCFNTYMDARKRLSDRNKNRGFWNSSKGNSQWQKGKFKGKGKGSFKGRKPLAQRILKSECRRCGARGHWKAECPLNRQGSAGQSGSNSAKEGAFAGTITSISPQNDDDVDMIPIHSHQDVAHLKPSHGTCYMVMSNHTPGSSCHASASLSQGQMSRFLSLLKKRLSPQLPRSPEPESAPVPADEADVAMFVSHGLYGIVDLGASQSIIGRQQVHALLSCLPEEVKMKVREVSCSTTFRFGNSSTVNCRHALLIPLSRWLVKICVVDSQTPFLISNNVFRTLGASIDTAQDTVSFAKLGFSMKLSLSEKKLYLLDFCKLVSRAQTPESVPRNPTGKEPPVMHVQNITGSDACTENLCSVASLPSNSIESPYVQNSGDQVTTDHVGAVVGRTLLQGDREEESGRVPEDVLCRSVGTKDHLRRGQSESALHRCSPAGSQVCEMVHREVPGQPEAGSSLLPLLHQHVCGTHGADPGDRSDRVTFQQPGAEDPEGQVKERPSGIISSDREVNLVGRRAQSFLERGGRGEPARPPSQQHGEHLGPDRATDAGPDPDGDSAPSIECPAELRAGENELEFRSLICDEIGCQAVVQQLSDVNDAAYFHDVLLQQSEKHNWVYEEMWTYWKKKFSWMKAEEVRQHWSVSKCDLLEVYCSEDSQLTKQAVSNGLKAFRFGLRHGDLSTFLGRTKLYDVLWICRPKHIWTSPRCGPWSQWNHLNAGKSIALAERIQQDRRSESVHLLLCDGLFRLQDWRGSTFHFHLEQPQGSELVHQDEVETLVKNTFKAACDMCVAGQLRHPNSHELLRKRTQIHTTSEIMWHVIQKFQCVGHHHHDPIAGSCKPQGYPRMNLTKYTEMYTALFGRRLSRAMQCSNQVQEKTIGHRHLSVFAVDTVHEDPEPKRRRLSGKFHPEHLFVPAEPSSSSPANPETSRMHADEAVNPHSVPTVSRLLEIAEHCAPRVGKVVFQDGPLFEAAQTRYPDKVIVAIDVCRGIDKLRICPIGSKGLAPYRRSVGKRRSDLQAFEDESWEAWEELSKRQQVRKGTPSRLLVTIFASSKRASPHTQLEDSESKRICPSSQNSGVDSKDVVSEDVQPQDVPVPQPDKPVDTSSGHIASDRKSQTEADSVKCRQHGPKFLALELHDQNAIKKIHQNLGHPDNRVLQLALKRYGWSDRAAAACTDFACPACMEQQLPKIARPGKLSQPRDFNDHISFDGAEWRDPNGKVYSFYHFIDSATNYHVAIPYQQRTTQGLIDAFTDAWLRWAGPPKSLMFDSATEANSEGFGKFLQDHAIQSYVIPTEAHWQLGRAERHGATLMRMIDKYHAERPICNHDDFNQCLVHLCHAKNAMSRHEGYTPELWVLGKMKPVPGGNSNQYLDSASFSGLDDATTEGSRFQELMARREAARVAFVRADHCATLRRALHARSRPDRISFQAGDFIMYWKDGKGAEKGAWHGPAKVLMLEGPNLVWISHMTRLFRCAPGHVRLLSTDEARVIQSQDHQMFQMPSRSGTGVSNIESCPNRLGLHRRFLEILQ